MTKKMVKNDEKRPKMAKKSPKTANLMPSTALGGGGGLHTHKAVLGPHGVRTRGGLGPQAPKLP